MRVVFLFAALLVAVCLGNSDAGKEKQDKPEKNGFDDCLPLLVGEEAAKMPGWAPMDLSDKKFAQMVQKNHGLWKALEEAGAKPDSRFKVLSAMHKRDEEAQTAVTVRLGRVPNPVCVLFKQTPEQMKKDELAVASSKKSPSKAEFTPCLETLKAQPSDNIGGWKADDQTPETIKASVAKDQKLAALVKKACYDLKQTFTVGATSKQTVQMTTTHAVELKFDKVPRPLCVVFKTTAGDDKVTGGKAFPALHTKSFFNKVEAIYKLLLTYMPPRCNLA